MRPDNKATHARLMVLRCVVVHCIATPRPMLTELFATWSEEEQRDFDDHCRREAEATVGGMKKLGIWKHASPAETTFLQSYGSTMDEYAHRAASWRVECAAMLMWALGLLDDWPAIDEESGTDMLEQVPICKVGLLSRHPSLRNDAEIDAKRDLIELWHWRVRTRRLIEDGASFEPTEQMVAAGLTSFDNIVRFSAKAAYENGQLPELIDEDFVFRGKAFRELTPDEYQQATSIIMERHQALNWLCGMAPGNRWDDTPTDT